MTRVSVIIPTYNYGQFIENTIGSVLAQTYPNIEIIVVDDGSTDTTSEIISRKYKDRLRYFYQENAGASRARNKGISESSGEYLIFLDADDSFSENQIYLFEKLSNNYPDDIIYGPWVRYAEVDGTEQELFTREEFTGDDMLDGWLKGWYIASCAVFWPRKILDVLGGWDEKLLANQDGDIAMRALIHNFHFRFCPDAYSFVRTHPKEHPSISNTVSEGTLYSRLTAVEKIENMLREKNSLDIHRKAVAESYYNLSKHFVLTHPDFSEECFKRYKKLYGYRKPPGSVLNWIFITLLGLEKKEKLSCWVDDFLNRGKSHDNTII